jgi:hypothetical protein
MTNPKIPGKQPEKSRPTAKPTRNKKQRIMGLTCRNWHPGWASCWPGFASSSAFFAYVNAQLNV